MLFGRPVIETPLGSQESGEVRLGEFPKPEVFQAILTVGKRRFAMKIRQTLIGTLHNGIPTFKYAVRYKGREIPWVIYFGREGCTLTATMDDDGMICEALAATGEWEELA